MPDVLSGKVNYYNKQRCEDFNNNKSYEKFADLLKDNPIYENRNMVKIITVWEDDYKHNKRKVRNSILSDIKKYINNESI